MDEPNEPMAIVGAAPVSDIAGGRYLLRAGPPRRTVERNPDGSLHHWVHSLMGRMDWPIPAPLASWMDQDGAVLAWRLMPGTGRARKAWRLCLVDRQGSLLWREDARGLPVTLPPAVAHGYGGPALGRGGRLRHQSLTSASGSHTLVHQEDGNLVLYCNSAHEAVWATGTWWAGDGWAELTDDGDLAVRNVCSAAVWRSGTAGSAAQRLEVNDDGTVALRGADGEAAWAVRAHAPCGRPGLNVARGSVLRRSQLLQRQSLTSADGGTVLAHRDDRRLVLFAEDGSWLWEQYIWRAEHSSLVLDDDGMLRVRADDGAVALELGGPGDELAVVAGEVRLCRADGTMVWRNGERVTQDGPPPGEDHESWIEALVDERVYCVTVIHDVPPDEALARLGAQPGQVATGSWQDLQDQVGAEDAFVGHIAVAAFALGPHTLLVEDNGWQGVQCPQLSQGTFAVSCYRSINADASFVVYRDGQEVANHSYDNGSAEPTTPEVQAALTAMGADDLIDAAYDHDLELLCRTAGVHPTVADVTGEARITIMPLDLASRAMRRQAGPG